MASEAAEDQIHISKSTLQPGVSESGHMRHVYCPETRPPAPQAPVWSPGSSLSYSEEASPWRGCTQCPRLGWDVRRVSSRDDQVTCTYSRTPPPLGQDMGCSIFRYLRRNTPVLHRMPGQEAHWGESAGGEKGGQRGPRLSRPSS